MFGVGLGGRAKVAVFVVERRVGSNYISRVAGMIDLLAVWAAAGGIETAFADGSGAALQLVAAVGVRVDGRVAVRV